MVPALLLAAALSAAPPDESAVVQQVPNPPAWEIWMGASGGLRPERGAGATGWVGVNRRFFGFLRPELALGAGAYSWPGELITEVRAGSRFELVRDGWAPWVSVAFAHHHETPFEHAAMAPASALLGLSEHGVHHRTGVELGLGASLDLPARAAGRLAGRIGAKFAVTQLLGEGAPRHFELQLTMGVAP